MVTSPFGYRVHPISGVKHLHNGLDLSVPQGTPVYASAPGTVVKVNPVLPNRGARVDVQHGKGRGSLYTYYGHLSRIDVRVGQRVRRGQQLGLSGGQEGTPGAGSSTGPHLHFVVKRRVKVGGEWVWKAVDPRQFMGNRRKGPGFLRWVAAAGGAFWLWRNVRGSRGKSKTKPRKTAPKRRRRRRR